jgi:hypothetical protein
MTTDDPTPPRGFPAAAWPVLEQRPPRHNGVWHAARAYQSRDDTTRYLCAAAHMDDDFADDAVREYLIEDTRPAPETPGVNVATVLAEAIAARTRRKLRDIGLILLMLGFCVLAPVAWVASWIVVACLVSVPSVLSAMKRRPSAAKMVLYVLGAVGGFAALSLLVPVLDLLPSDGSSSSGYPFDSSPSYYNELPESTTDGWVVGTVVVMVAILAVVVADRFTVWRHLHDRFWPNRLTELTPWTRDRTLFQFSSDRQVAQLDRYANPRVTMKAGETDGAPVPVIVYRDFVPFVGAGVPVEPWSIAVPLKRLPDAEPTVELTTDSLYREIRGEVTSLREATGLTPGRRLLGLDLGEQVIVSADELVDHLADPTSTDFLGGIGVAPYSMVSRERADEIRTDPLEWARYYQCYRVETWDRDLVVTVFVHVAVGTGALYVEWTPCVLRPVKRKFQAIDTMPRSPWRPAWRAIVDLLKLPVSIPLRVRSVFSFLRPLPQDHGMVVPAAYGSAASLRELAADGDVHNYFQLADVDRYLKVMEGRLVLAVSRMMRAAGYSAAAFDEQAAAVVNNNVAIVGSAGNVVVGSGNTVTTTA